MKLYPQILNNNQTKLLNKLGFLKDYSAYLAGGTAGALQLGHRTSLDFDFYTPKQFDSERVGDIFNKSFSNINISENQPKDTFQAIILEVNLSLFHYPYKLVGELVDFREVELASLTDISAMKIAAIVQRGKQRDFIDLYYLIKRLGIEKVIKAAYQKYPWYEENNQIIFTALTYFTDADRDEEINRITVFDKQLTWEKVKKEILREVKTYQKTV